MKKVRRYKLTYVFYLLPKLGNGKPTLFLYHNLKTNKHYSIWLISRGNGSFSSISPKPFKLQASNYYQKSSDCPPEEKL